MFVLILNKLVLSNRLHSTTIFIVQCLDWPPRAGFSIFLEINRVVFCFRISVSRNIYLVIFCCRSLCSNIRPWSSEFPVHLLWNHISWFCGSCFKIDLFVTYTSLVSLRFSVHLCVNMGFIVLLNCVCVRACVCGEVQAGVHACVRVSRCVVVHARAHECVAVCMYISMVSLVDMSIEV